MKRSNLLLTSLLLTAWLACSGCGAKKQLTALDDEPLRKQSELLSGSDVFRLFLAASEGATNGAQVMERYRETLTLRSVEILMQQTPTELRRKLDTLGRGSNMHPYTREQLEEALRRKEDNKRTKLR